MVGGMCGENCWGQCPPLALQPPVDKFLVLDKWNFFQLMIDCQIVMSLKLHLTRPLQLLSVFYP